MFSNKSSAKAPASAASKPNTSTSTPVKSETAQPAPVKAAAAVPSIISKDLRIEGNLHSAGDIQVDGTVVGDINSRSLTIGESASVEGVVSCETVRVCGTVKGQIKANSVVIAKSAHFHGDLEHQSLAIEAGAFLEGNIRRMTGDQDAADKSAASDRPSSLAPAKTFSIMEQIAERKPVTAGAETDKSLAD